MYNYRVTRLHWRTVGLGITGIVAVVAIAFLYLLPRLIAVHPLLEDGRVNGYTPVTITFSRPMDLESVKAHLQMTPPTNGEFVTEGNQVIFQPSEPWAAGTLVTLTLNTGARSQLGLPLLQSRVWQFQVIGIRLAYLYPLGGQAELYAIEPDEGTIQQLTQTNTGVTSFHVSPDGRGIYYSARNQSDGSNIYYLDLAQNQTQRMITCGKDTCQNPLLSPQGDYLAYERMIPNPNGIILPEVWLHPMAGDDDFRVSMPGDVIAGFSWHPDNRLGFLLPETNQVILFQPETRATDNFEFRGDNMGVWSPDGTYFLGAMIVPLSTPLSDMTLPKHLWLYRLSEGFGTDISQESYVEDNTPAISPDGNWIVFGRKYLTEEQWTPGRQIWMMRPDGSDARKLTNQGDYNFTEFQWSPDGRRISYLRFHQTSPHQPPELWLMDMDGSNAIRLLVNAYAAEWIP